MLLLPFFMTSLGAPDHTNNPGMFKTDFEFRTRFERRNDRDFTASSSDNVSQVFNRFRFGATYSEDNWLARVQLQYTHTLNWSVSGNRSNEDLEASLMYLQLTDGPRQWTLGRQKIALSGQRLIGPLEWANQARSFDGIRLQSGRYDMAFFGIGVSANRPRDARVGYLSFDSELGNSSYILKLDRESGRDVTVHTFDHVWRGTAGASALEAEVVGQIGQSGGKDLGAFGLHFGATIPSGDDFRFKLDANLATGGQSASYSRTLDNLYPTNHLFYGSADMFGWRNMEELAFGVNYSVDPKTSVGLSVRKFWLFDASDGWYGAGGGLNKRPGGLFIDPTGGSGTDIGSEIDLEFSQNLGTSGSLNAGVVWFMPGRFVKNQLGGSARTQTWTYFSYGVKF